MEKYIVTTGKTIELAIEAALAQLKLDRDSVSVEVLKNARSGFLGIGSSPAEVKVTYEVPDEDTAPKTALSSASLVISMSPVALAAAWGAEALGASGARVDDFAASRSLHVLESTLNGRQLRLWSSSRLSRGPGRVDSSRSRMQKRPKSSTRAQEGPLGSLESTVERRLEAAKGLQRSVVPDGLFRQRACYVNGAGESGFGSAPALCG